jgi:hypothetical protein
MSSEGVGKLFLPLDERNLADVLSAVAIVALASRNADSLVSDNCCWREEGFLLETRVSLPSLLQDAHDFVRRMRWIHGLGPVEQGTFATDDEIGFNPFWPLSDARERKASGKQERSPFKAFSGQVKPGGLLSDQQQVLQPPDDCAAWLTQLRHGAGSWGFDCRVGSHAYDQGYSSNEEGSGDLDPIYPAIELLSIAAASFFCAVHGWQSDEVTVRYSVWTEPISFSLVPYAVAGRLKGLPSRRYCVANRGAAYGEGRAYRFFPEAKIDT